MTSFFGPGGQGSSPFDDFLARFLGASGTSRPVQRVDITQLMTPPAQELVAGAVRFAVERGARDLDAHHLLWAATQQDGTRTMLERAGADASRLAETIDENVPRREATEEPPVLAPAAKRALLDAHQIARTLGSSYIDPDHLLLALAAKPQQVFTREMLLEQVWGYHYKADTRLVNVHVQRLRSKVERDPERPEVVLTVRGVGYKAGPP